MSSVFKFPFAEPWGCWAPQDWGLCRSFPSPTHGPRGHAGQSPTPHLCRSHGSHSPGPWARLASQPRGEPPRSPWSLHLKFPLLVILWPQKGIPGTRGPRGAQPLTPLVSAVPSLVPALALEVPSGPGVRLWRYPGESTEPGSAHTTSSSFLPNDHGCPVSPLSGGTGASSVPRR